MNETELSAIVSVWNVAAEWRYYDPSDRRTLDPQRILLALGSHNPDTKKIWLPVYRYRGEATDPNTGEIVYFCDLLNDDMLNHLQEYGIRYEELCFDPEDVKNYAANFPKYTTWRTYNLVGKSTALLLIDEQDKNKALQKENQALQNENNKLADQVVKAHEEARQTATTKIIVTVSNSLWAGKTPKAIYDTMKEKGFADDLIAYVLNQPQASGTKTEKGRLFLPGGSDDSVYRSRFGSLVAQAISQYNVIFTD